MKTEENELKIAIVGQGHINKHNVEIMAARLLEQNKKAVIVVSDTNFNDVNTFEVNGVKYREKGNPLHILYHYFTEHKIFKQVKVNIVTEYGLIQNKQSRLTKSNRDWVVNQFEKKFEIIK